MNPKVPVDVAFMFPAGGGNRSCKYHLGIAYIQTVLAKHGYNSRQIIPPAGSTLVEFAELLIATNVPLVGFSCYNINLYLIRFLASYIKKKKPSVIILGGGPAATFSDELILKQIPEIDIVVRFEGEITTLELVKHVLTGAPNDCLDDIKGISFRRNGSIVRTPNRPLFCSGGVAGEELQGLLSPYIEGVLDGTEGAGILTARGCVHHCTYCNFSAMSRHTIRYHPIDTIINELEIIHTVLNTRPMESSIIKTISIHDDAFSLNPHRAKKICRRIIESDIKLKLSCLCRADNLDEELVFLLKQAGFITISFGIESAVPKILRNIKKICNIPPASDDEKYLPERRFLEKVKKGVFWAKRCNIDTDVSIILGLPGETYEQGLETIKFVENLGVDTYAHNFLGAFPGTEVFNKASNYDIKVKFYDSRLQYKTTHSYNVSKLPFLENSSLHEECQETKQTLIQTLAGGKVFNLIAGDGISSVNIFINKPSDLRNVFGWLSNYLAVNGDVFVFTNENASQYELAEILNVNYAAFLPTERRYILNTFSGTTTEINYEFLEGKFIKWNFQFPVVQFTEYMDFQTNMEQSDIEVFPIFYLKEKTDIKILSALTEILDQKDDHGEPSTNFVLNGVFLDGCRWGRSICPALELRRIVITDSCQIKACMTGETLGAVGDNIQDIRNHAKDLFKRLQKERKCAECTIDSWCAKCLFPFPLSQQEYCEQQRSSFDISRIIVSSKMVNTYRMLAEL